MISLTGNETEDREIMANFYSGVYAGKMQANSFIVDTDLYMDVEKNYYQGADIVSQDYLGSNDLDQAQNYIDPLFELEILDERQQDQLISLGLMQDGDDWSDVKVGAKTKWL